MVFQVSSESLWNHRIWEEIDNGQIKTGYKEIFLQPKSGQQVEVVNAESVHSFKNAYDRSCNQDMNVNIQVQVSTA